MSQDSRPYSGYEPFYLSLYGNFPIPKETGGVFVTAPKSANLDRRIGSRDNIILSCRLIFEGNKHDALISDISPGGAFVHSDFLPPVGSEVSIQTEPALVGVRLNLKAKILRRGLKKMGRTHMEGFGIQFSKSSSSLQRFINKFAKPQNE
jgi:hypothetical protein